MPAIPTNNGPCNEGGPDELVFERRSHGYGTCVSTRKDWLNWRTWRPGSQKGPRTARWSRRYPSSKTELLASSTATRSRCGRGPRQAEPSIAQARSPARTARSAILIPRSWRLLSRTANGWPAEPGASASASGPAGPPQTTSKVRPKVALKPRPSMSNSYSHLVPRGFRMGVARSVSLKFSPVCSISPRSVVRSRTSSKVARA